MMHSYMAIQPEVQEAIDKGHAVVALESTIISHGMPYPRNIETAHQVQAIVRDRGAIPATIAIIDGKCCVGLSSDQLELFGKASGVWKSSLRDIPYVISQKLYGATTVAATMRIASMAGIKIFVTGGIGGVHRAAETTMDISADLIEMGRTSVAVISAGIKSILDIGLTLEKLETLGVPVITIGQDEFPSFYSTKSGYLSPLRMDKADDIARTLKIKWSMGIEGSVLIANPVTADHEISADKMEKYIQKALKAAAENKIHGKDITPFLLKYIAGHSSGESLDTNISLIKNNAAIGADIAIAFSKC
jgi:pseudouridine-5'-phosphate glycosidase